MPWPGTTFKRHNKSLSDAEARKAGKQATALLKAGVPEGESIAIANKAAKKRKIKDHEKLYKKD